MKRTFFRIVAVAGVIGLIASCNDDTTAPRPGMAPPPRPVFGTATELNGSGACMGDDALAANGLVANWVSGVGSATDVRCTSNDISVANATLSGYTKTAGGTLIPLGPTDTISCSPGDTIYAEVIANLHSTATERYNIGIWIADPPGSGSAVTGSCTQYNLIPGVHGSEEINSPPDVCGDMTSAADTVKVDLQILKLVCPTGQTHVTINNCIGWQNSDQTSARGSCPNLTMGTTTVDSAHAFRYGTLPETKSKCNCTPFRVPIEVRGKITIVKKTVGGDGTFGFTSDVGANGVPDLGSTFNIVTSADSGSQIISQVKAGTYHITESTLAADFDFTSLSCHSNNAFASATTSNTTRMATITILNGGGDIVCTYTNTKRTFLTLVKTISNDNGGTKTLSDFPLTADGPTSISGVSGTTAVTGRQVSAGTYTLSETTVAGYTPSTWSCNAGSLTGSNLTLATGNSATCTINNDDVGATLTLVKVVTNNSGGSKTLSDFPLTASGPSTISGVSGTTDVTGRSVKAGAYVLSEQTVAGYTPGSWSCTGVTPSGSNITLGLAGAATCTITNDDQPAHLTLVKVVTNDDGGTKTLSDFPLTASGPTSFSGVSGTTAVTNRQVSAGTYTLSETTVAGYTPSSWSCTGVTPSGSSITLDVAGAATCTISNDDQQASLTLVKVVTNNSGGSKTLSDFPLTASGPTSFSGVSGTADVTNHAVDAGTYALSEQTVAGYTPGSWSCTGVTPSGSNITLGVAGAATCTITNDDQPAHLTLVKVVTNDNGGTKTLSDFPLSATGPSTISGVSGTTAVTTRQVNAGTYALTEQTQANYTASSWSCSGGTQSGSNISLALGGSATCTISNDDIPLGRGAIAPTQTTCQDFAASSFSPLTTLQAQLKGFKVNSVSPGVFFYYATVAKAGLGAIGFTQTVTDSAAHLPLYDVQNGQAYLYDLSCNRVATLTLVGGAYTGGDGLPAGDYLLGVKFETAAAKGTSVPHDIGPNDLLGTHKFQITGGGSLASVETRVKP